jgi:hypothetical protein
MTKNPAEELRKLMARHGLTRPQAAELASVAKVTVDSWLAPETAALHRRMKPRDLDLIRLRMTALKRK